MCRGGTKFYVNVITRLIPMLWLDCFFFSATRQLAPKCSSACVQAVNSCTELHARSLVSLCRKQVHMCARTASSSPLDNC